MIYQTQSEYARSHGVSRERVSQWIKSGRLPVYRMCARVALINKNTPLPVHRKTGRPTNKSKDIDS